MVNKTFCDICKEEIPYRPNIISLDDANHGPGLKSLDACRSCFDIVSKFIKDRTETFKY